MKQASHENSGLKKSEKSEFIETQTYAPAPIPFEKELASLNSKNPIPRTSRQNSAETSITSSQNSTSSLIVEEIYGTSRQNSAEGASSQKSALSLIGGQSKTLTPPTSRQPYREITPPTSRQSSTSSLMSGPKLPSEASGFKKMMHGPLPVILLAALILASIICFAMKIWPEGLIIAGVALAFGLLVHFINKPAKENLRGEEQAQKALISTSSTDLSAIKADPSNPDLLPTSNEQAPVAQQEASALLGQEFNQYLDREIIGNQEKSFPSPVIEVLTDVEKIEFSRHSQPRKSL